MRPPTRPRLERARDEDARAAILRDIRGHLEASGRGASEADAAGRPGAPASVAVTEGQALDRSALLTQFRNAVLTVAGHCHVVHDVTGAALAVRAILDVHAPRRIVLSDAALVRQVFAATGTDAEMVTDAGPPAVFACQVGVTSAQWAIAETGTLVLDSDAERHRLASLVPPVHIALVPADRVRPTIGSVLRELAGRGPDRLARCVTFITGPSRTSDIELTLAIGVHGPGELHVLVIENIGVF